MTHRGGDQTEYMRRYRQTPAGKAQLDAQRKREKAKRAAVSKLIDRYESEFETLFLIELRKLTG